jgi:hypothetical protein
MSLYEIPIESIDVCTNVEMILQPVPAGNQRCRKLIVENAMLTESVVLDFLTLLFRDRSCKSF